MTKTRAYEVFETYDNMGGIVFAADASEARRAAKAAMPPLDGFGASELIVLRADWADRFAAAIGSAPLPSGYEWHNGAIVRS